MKHIFLTLILLVMVGRADDAPAMEEEAAASTVQVRPHVGYGTGQNKHVGFRLLMHSSDTQSYGLEITRFQNNHDGFTAAGIVLEQKMWGWFHMSVGTIGYFKYGAHDENAIGLVSNLGWEPDNNMALKPFVTYRNDTIFAKGKTDIIHSLSAGVTFEF
jgi:hypothetical protein